MPVLAEADGSFLVTPNWWVMAYVLVCFLGGVVTAAKGRWGWLFAGFLLGGVIWPLTALLSATPGSVWRRTLLRRSELRSSSAR